MEMIKVFLLFCYASICLFYFLVFVLAVALGPTEGQNQIHGKQKDGPHVTAGSKERKSGFFSKMLEIFPWTYQQEENRLTLPGKFTYTRYPRLK